MSKADNRPADEMSMEDILASIRKMMAEDQDVMDTTRSDRDAGLPPERSAVDEEVIDLIDELPEDGVTVRSGTAPDDAPPAWDVPPEDELPEFAADQSDELLDLETEFAIQDAAPPAETAAQTDDGGAQGWQAADNVPLVQQPITVGLPISQESIDTEDGGRDQGNAPRFIQEPRQAAPDTASFDGPADSVVASTTAEPVDSPDGMAHEPHEEVESMDAPKDRILSPEAAVKTSAAFDQLAQTLISGYDGDSNTLEGVVRAILKPLLKEWLDANLPRIVEESVQAEIRRLSR